MDKSDRALLDWQSVCLFRLAQLQLLLHLHHDNFCWWSVVAVAREEGEEGRMTQEGRRITKKEDGGKRKEDLKRKEDARKEDGERSTEKGRRKDFYRIKEKKKIS